MFKAVLTVALLFSFQAFAGKETKTKAKPISRKEFANPDKNARNTEVNTNLGWAPVKKDLKETSAQVKAKWNGFTPEKRDEAPARKTASARESKKSKASATR